MTVCHPGLQMSSSQGKSQPAERSKHKASRASACASAWLEQDTFLDDDVRIREFDGVTRLVDQLEVRQVAGMRVPQFPDNSVGLPARRLSGPFQMSLSGELR